MTSERRGWRDHPLIQPTLVRYREFFREPEAVFWVFVFPVLLTAGLGLAFRNQAPERTRVAIVEGEGARRVEETLAHSGVFTGSVTLRPVEKPAAGNWKEVPAVECFFGDVLELVYRDELSGSADGTAESRVEVKVVIGTDGRLASFSKRFGEEALAIPDIIRTQAKLIPHDEPEIRVVDIKGLDRQADGGTHVRSTLEVGLIEVVKTESEGKANKRMRIRVVTPPAT